jgi:hypothetical protein
VCGVKGGGGVPIYGGRGGSRGFLAPTPLPITFASHGKLWLQNWVAQELEAVRPNQWPNPFRHYLWPLGTRMLYSPHLVGPACIELFWFGFGPYVGLHVSLIVLHGFPLFSATVVWTSLGPLPRWVPGPTSRWAPGTTRLVPHGAWWREAQGLRWRSTRIGSYTYHVLCRGLLDVHD